LEEDMGRKKSAVFRTMDIIFALILLLFTILISRKPMLITKLYPGVIITLLYLIVRFNRGKKKYKRKTFKYKLKKFFILFSFLIILILISIVSIKFDFININLPYEKILLWASIPLTITLIIIISVFIIKKISKSKLASCGIDEVDKMSGEQFEDFLESLFRRKGYKVDNVPLTRDFGADLVVRKGNKKIAIQAKRYSDNVSLDAVQEIIGALAYYKANEGMVVTNSHYTKSAIELAEVNSIKLWDREQLIEEMLS